MKLQLVSGSLSEQLVWFGPSGYDFDLLFHESQKYCPTDSSIV